MSVRTRVTQANVCVVAESFMHVHLGIDGTGLENLDIHYTVIDEWVRFSLPPPSCLLNPSKSIFRPSTRSSQH